MNEPDDREMAAAEYVLGTLDAVERAEVDEKCSAHRSWREAVEAWQVRLGPLVEGALPVQPPPHVYSGLMDRVFPAAPARPDTPSAEIRTMRASLRRWRAASVALTGLAASLLLWVATRPANQPRMELVAVLQQEAGQPAILIDVDVSARRLTIRPLGTSTPVGKSLELWLIDPSLGAPRSLGTIAAQGRTQTSLPALDPAAIADATYAVTVEPAGGSPTGAPSGKPVLVGHLAPAP